MIAIGADHAGVFMKNDLKKFIEDMGYEVKDFGTFTDESCDYPVYAKAVSEAVAKGDFEKGILVCGTGIGMSIAANKHKGIRAAACSDTYSARLTKMHNNTNIICFGERVVGAGLACDITDAFLDAEFEGGKHQIRIDMISSFEENDQ